MNLSKHVTKAVTSRRNGRSKLEGMTNDAMNKKPVKNDYKAPFLSPTLEDVSWGVKV